MDDEVEGPLDALDADEDDDADDAAEEPLQARGYTSKAQSAV